MRVLIDLTSLADNFSGIERYAACLSCEMIDRNENEYILIFKNKVHPMFHLYQTQKNVNIVIIPACKKLFFNQIRLPLEIMKHKADWYLFLAFPVPIFLFKKNMVSTIHDICCWDCPETMNGWSDWYFKISHRIAMMKCKRIITISQFSENRIVDRLKYPRNKIWRIYCGVDEKFLNYETNKEESLKVKKKYNLPDEYFLSLSTLEPRKNLKLLINGYCKFYDNNNHCLPLVLAGRRGWKMNELLDSINDRVRDKIHFTGFIDDDDLPVVYGNAQLFIFPSMYEGFGIPPLEAIACGTKVLSSNAASLPEVLGGLANYFESNDVLSFVEALENCLLDQKKKNVYISFRWKNEAKKLLKELKDCNEEKNRY